MASSQGRPLSGDFRKSIVLVKDYFDSARGDFGIKESSYALTADALKIGEATVRRVVASYNKNPNFFEIPPESRGRPSFAIADSHDQSVRSFIRESNRSGKFVTLESIRTFLVKHSGYPEDFKLATLARTLDRWGFTFGKGTRSQHLKEKDHVIAARRRYLRRKMQNRNANGGEKFNEVYLDESYVNKNHSNDFTWYFGEDGPWLQKPTGAGERLIIINAITESGWVPGAKLVFKSGRKTGDYHGQMNHGVFEKWFKEMLLPNIPSKSLIILDNASYHNTLCDSSAPIATSSKLRIKSWLESNKIPCSEDCVKAELIEILKKLAPEPTYTIDEQARLKGHEILRTPPYHPELQPIEICWGITKNHIARNSDFTMANLYNQLENGFEKVTESTCKKIIKKICDNEDQYWNEDHELDNLNSG